MVSMGGRMFEALGLEPKVEQVYLYLLEHSGSSASQIARGTGLSDTSLREALRSAETLGLVSRAPSAAARFLPIEPDVAVEALIVRRQEGLEDARRLARALSEQFRPAFEGRRVPDLVHLVEGDAAVSQSFAQLQARATSEVLLFDRLPMLLGPRNPFELERLKRGVTYRTVYDLELLELPEYSEWIRDAERAGERARVISGVPAKLAIADRSVALIPLNLEMPRLTSVLSVSGSSLLDVLILFFETLWERAEPLHTGAGPSDVSDTQEGNDEAQQVLSLLSAGLQDASIARALGVSRSTVTRRVRGLMDQLSAGSRFQAGLHAARQGLVPDPSRDDV